jgi:magnesium-transporting ATPase (P-type)
MLTGDKGETAHSIAFACGLYPNPLSTDFKAFKIDDSPFGETMNEDDLQAWRLQTLDSIIEFRDTEFGVTISGNSIV